METHCKHFPCHTNIPHEDFRCNQCFCPLYHIKECGGNAGWLFNGVKDCSSCTRPHLKQGQDEIIMVLKSHMFNK